ncbi:hypothetical protein [Sphingobium sp. CECT 9361]|uniref:hypothetical protein n=1 Tax=Sphingobium sp. CECT 9361 TaxID=2845384 RepID=UPI001E570512|nr:hypothetical protein [Sphingobium sp. CECT 9361]CAH0356175.1 hypothetical protein SPH9361_03923 [Sphingobium sp. CECT 9361]
MKTRLASLALLLLVTACGRQESVSEVPNSEQLAADAKAAADEAAKKTGASDAVALENRNYVNTPRGFSITLPEGWVRNTQTSTAEGVVSEDPGAGADVRVFWSANSNDQDLRQIVEAMNDQSEAVDGDFVGENEYRGTANDGEGNSVAVRMVRKKDGSLVTATFVYPEMLSEQYQAIGQRTLDSLRVFDAAVTPPAEAAPAAASNAAN